MLEQTPMRTGRGQVLYQDLTPTTDPVVALLVSLYLRYSSMLVYSVIALDVTHMFVVFVFYLCLRLETSKVINSVT